jgi:LuxR family quorum sensing-dependent transcriptional regulator
LGRTVVFGLSERELECLQWVAAGKSEKEIAAVMRIPLQGVRYSILRARQKLGADTTQEAAKLVDEHPRLSIQRIKRG